MNNHSTLPPEPEELLILAQGFCDGTLSGSDAARLEALLHADRDSQRLFLACRSARAALLGGRTWRAGQSNPRQYSRSGSAGPGLADTDDLGFALVAVGFSRLVVA